MGELLDRQTELMIEYFRLGEQLRPQQREDAIDAYLEYVPVNSP